MLIIYKEISVLVRTVSGRPQYVEVESSELEFLTICNQQCWLRDGFVTELAGNAYLLHTCTGG